MNAIQRPQHIGVFSPRALKRTVRLGVKSIWLHGLRSLLTVLGIVFGVCSVIAMLAVSEGASQNVQEQIRRLGSNNIILESKKPPDEEESRGGRPRALEYGLTYKDMRTIENVVPGVTVIVPARVIREYVRRSKHNVEAEITGTVPWYPAMRKRRVARGRFISEIDMDTRANVCVLGPAIANELFPIDDPIGKSVRVRSDYYRVVGMMEAAGTPTAASADPNVKGMVYQLFIPLTAARDRFGETLVKRSSGSFQSEKVELHEAVIQVANIDDVVETGKIIDEILAGARKRRDYSVTVPLELLQNAEETKRIFNIVLGAIAGISLIVGGIGIMNIMLATVTERTREIGIRRALGAKRRDIIMQFLVETVILSGTGGIIGVALGISIPFFITYFSDMPTQVTPWAPILAFSISGLVGIVFGIYPAMRAADMDPVEALRHE